MDPLEHEFLYGTANKEETTLKLFQRLVDQSDFEKAEALASNALPSGKLKHALGFYHYKAGRYEEALVAFKEAQELLPNNLVITGNLALTHRLLGNFREAEGIYRWLIYKGHSEVEYPLSEVLLMQGRCEEGWQLYETRFTRTSPTFKHIERYTSKGWEKWEGSKSHSLVLLGEQGLGDCLMMLRYIPLVAKRVKNIYVDFLPEQKGLLPLFQKLGVKEKTPAIKLGNKRFLPLMDLPRVFKTTLNNIPPTPALFSTSPTQRRIGVCWQGNPKYAYDASRSVEFEQIKHLFLVPGITFVNLCKGVRVENIENPITANTSIIETAEIVAGLDLVISVDTMIAHLAGCLGVPTLLLNRSTSEWRWGWKQELSPWYPSMRILNQSKARHWGKEIKEIAQMLLFSTSCIANLIE